MRTLNKSQAIRDYLAKNPDAKPSVVESALKRKGVNYANVCAVMYKRPRGKLARQITRSFVNGLRKRRGDDLMGTLLAAKRMADKLGGISRAKEAVACLEKITG